MAVSTPDWLAKRGGELRLNFDGHTWAACFGGGPQYFLRPLPAAGKFTCEVEQTNNGRRLESNTIYATEDDALRGGLEDLRKALGW